LEQIKTLDAGSWFDVTFKNQAIPTLVDTIKCLVNHELNANIEIKPSSDDEATANKTTKTVIKLLKEHWPSTKKAPLISSFNVHCLALAMQCAPEYPRGLLLDEWQDDCCQLASRYRCQNIHLNEECLTPERVKQIKDAGFVIYAYTVNDVKRAKELEQMGVDGIFSDNPQLLGLRHQKTHLSGRLTTTHYSIFQSKKISQSRQNIDEEIELSFLLHSRP
jgi:glycerophosphoryl diester phosphodiesterase